MANPVKGEADLSLKDGRTLKIVVDMEALVCGEASYGKPMRQLIDDAKAGFVGATRAILHGALATHHPNITKQEALAILQSDGEAVGEALNAAGSNSFPDAVEGKEGANPPGKNSGRSGAKRG